jgi:ABC-2 type transport system permease protein
MQRLWLVARREIVAYAGVPSFWVALLTGPLLMLLAALGAGAMGRAPQPPPAQVVAVEAPTAALAGAMKQAIEEAGDLEGRPVRVLADAAGPAAVRVHLSERPDGPALAVQGQPLSKTTVALLRRDVAAALRDQALAGGEVPVASIQVSEPAPPPAAPQDTGRFARFSMSTMLWLALVGSLGLLLQAVVRERSNRALESLLAAVRPSEIVLGKLLGVGALAVLVMGVWLLGGAAIAASPLAARAPIAALVLRDFGDVRTLALGATVFVLAFAMYGAAMIGVGALARDTTSAQNLSRPVFAMLLAVFFVALGQVSGMSGSLLPTLSLLPPFAPFALILAGPQALDGWRIAASLAGVGATSLLCLWLAVRALTGEPVVRRPERRTGGGDRRQGVRPAG